MYCLELLPRFATAVRELGTECKTVSVLAGDFVAPSILSCLDSGRASVDVLGACGIEYVCFGNHESDIPHAELLQRIEESTFAWINTNMTGLSLSPTLERTHHTKLPPHAIISTNDAQHSIALLGLNTPDPGLYRGRCFAGATIHPINTSLGKAVQEIGSKVSAVVPMTHQSVAEDRVLAAEYAGVIPIIIGGHDHEVYDEEVSGVRISKAGESAMNVGVHDFVWDESGVLKVTTQMIETKRFAECPIVRAKVESHKRLLHEVDRAVLFKVPRSLTSQRTRERQTTFASFILSQIRDTLNAECAIVNAGAIRGGGIYDEGYDFTFGDLKKEVPFETFVVAVDLSGKVLAEAVEASRCALPGGVVCGGKFLQACDAVAFCPGNHKRVTHIKGTPLDTSRNYRTVVHYDALMNRMDGIEPLYAYGENLVYKPPITIASPAKELILSRFAPK